MNSRITKYVIVRQNPNTTTQYLKRRKDEIHWTYHLFEATAFTKKSLLKFLKSYGQDRALGEGWEKIQAAESLGEKGTLWDRYIHNYMDMWVNFIPEQWKIGRVRMQPVLDGNHQPVLDFIQEENGSVA